MKRALVALVLLLGAAAAVVAVLNVRGEAPLPERTAPFSATAEQIARGAYLARIGNCAGCHTARGGMPYAGARGIATPFGTVYSSNLTPDAKTGIGAWTADHFWRALHNGRARDGRLLYPAFPYPQYTLMTRADADALYAYLMTLPAVVQARPDHALRFPYNTQAALAVWRALFFAPARFEPDAARPEAWNRGAYLVRGLAHCAACHASRNPFGASAGTLASGGAVLPMQGWYAPSLTAADEAGVADWDVEHIAALLTSGVAPRGSVLGPMAEVVFRSTQHLAPSDARAMAVFLKSLPQPRAAAPAAAPLDGAVREKGAAVYEDHCARCHGDDGRGAPGAYPALAGNRAVTMARPDNAIRIVLNGGYLPATAGNPRPYGMPPFSPLLDDAQVAAVLSYVRASWGNAGRPVLQREVQRQRANAYD